MTAGWEAELAEDMHESLCGYAGTECSRWKPGSPHRDFYELRAQNLLAALEPLIGIANVMPVMKIVLRELDL